MDLENCKYELPLMYEGELVMEMTNFQSLILCYYMCIGYMSLVYLYHYFLSDQSFISLLAGK